LDEKSESVEHWSSSIRLKTRKRRLKLRNGGCVRKGEEKPAEQITRSSRACGGGRGYILKKPKRGGRQTKRKRKSASVEEEGKQSRLVGGNHTKNANGI